MALPLSGERDLKFLIEFADPLMYSFLLAGDRVAPHLIQQSCQAAIELAAVVREFFRTSNPEILAQALGVDIRDLDSDYCPGGKYLEWARYEKKPPTIFVFVNGLRNLLTLARGTIMETFCSWDSLRGTALAHELYHHLEEVSWPGVNWQNLPSSPVLKEVCAHQFAQALLNLDIHPKGFDFLYLAAYHPKSLAVIREKAVYYLEQWEKAADP